MCRFRGVFVVSLLLYNDLSYGSFLTDKIIADNRETILETFFAESKTFLEQFDPRHVTVLGASDEQLRIMEPWLEAFSYFLGTDAEKICTSRDYSPDSVVVNFLPTSLTRKGLNKVFENLSICKGRQFYLILDGHSGIVFSDIDTVLRLTLEETKTLPLIIHHEDKEDSLKMYALVKAENCSRRSELILDWRPGDEMKVLDTWYTEYTPSAGCPEAIATMDRLPGMKLDGTRIQGGFEGKIILELAKEMNFTPVAKDFGHLKYERNSTVVDGIVQSCVVGDALIGIAHIRPEKSVISSDVGKSRPYSEECVVWCVPRILRWKGSPFFSEFAWVTWMLIGLMFLASFAIEKIVRNTRHLDMQEDGRKADCVRIILDIVGVTLGNPIIYRPISGGRKALLIIYICYAMVMTTAYKTSLTSILTLENAASSIVDVGGIIAANLTTGGHPSRLAILEDQRNDSQWTPELMKRFVIETNTSKALRRISKHLDFAYLTSRTEVDYHVALFKNSGEQITFDVLEGCVLRFSPVAVTQNWVGVGAKLNRVVRGLIESGIIRYWKQSYLDPRPSGSQTDMMNTQEALREMTRESIFLLVKLYCAVMALYAAVFLGEMIIHKYRSIQRMRRLDNLKMFKIRRRLQSL